MENTTSAAVSFQGVSKRYGRVQAQRVRFAVAMAGRPELLFLDEPTVAMDPLTRREFWAAVRATGITTVFGVKVSRA
jgi:ABC-type multidrug transport system ATPase subunit